MLDDRLIGTTFTLTHPGAGEVVLYGIHYHYQLLDAATTGDLVVVASASALGLGVRLAKRQLQY
ncbi:hypothetical protein ACFQ3L_06750 [Lacticaseibacillus jixianensis]|uniref:Uncharacterized protein n=1 Tax=Lacticaseibacillus jixianensis TaxID=2486012 RepID=A0ABW4B8B6_9LACO|nr:hypothetical protein [Lacticaseibacillus jixianensis]